MYIKKSLAFALTPLVFVIIYFQVFSAEYAYLDEINQLWYNKGHANYDTFFTQGRWLTGILSQKFFGSISSIEQLKYLRIFSLLGWIATSFLWMFIFRSWLKWLHLDARLAWLSNLFVVSSVSVCIYIGWASCFEVFLAVALGLLSGHLLFMQLVRSGNGGQLNILKLLVSLLAGTASLFLYQNGFGMFLLPFFLYYVQKRLARPEKIVVRGVLCYLAINVIYYLVFNYSLHIAGTAVSERAEIHFNILKKISFFISGPLPSAFSLNILYRSNSIFLQILPWVVMSFWVVTVFRRSNEKPISSKLIYLAVIFLLLALVYLPSMVATENFASNRTLFAFNLAVFIMILETIFSLLKTDHLRNYFILLSSAFLLITGFYTFNFQFINPLKKEYKDLKAYLEKNYRPSLQKVHFVRAERNLFQKKYAAYAYKDEFGAPSSSRDWVPEPITKQIIYEKTGNRELANKIIVQQYPTIDSFPNAIPIIDSVSLFIDINTIVK